MPESLDTAQRVWEDYAGRWQRFNQARTVFSGLSLVLAATGLAALSRSEISGEGDRPRHEAGAVT